MLMWGTWEVWLRSSSSPSCHQTVFFHSFTHCFPTSLNVMKSCKEQGCASWGQCNMCAVVSSALPQAHVVSPVQNFHFFLWVLLQVDPCAQTVESFSRGPWTVVTFRHLFVKFNNTYVRLLW